MSGPKLKPSIIWVPGACHLPSHYKPCTDILKSKGYRTITVRTASVRQTGPYPNGFSQDLGAIVSAILTELDEGHDVILVMHSYGGMPGSAAVEGLLKSDRELNGLAGGVIGLIYISSYVVDVGVNPMANGMGAPEEDQKSLVKIDEEGMLLFVDPVAGFYHDVQKDAAQKAAESLQPFAAMTLNKEQTYAPWKHLPSIYIICEDDKILLPAHQEAMASQEGGLWTVVRMKSGHSPFLSQPNELAAVIEQAVQNFTK
ncbi:alpha/beta-hydrolase [Microthyrium microscopicum]|uniref:Alpha/beta-hydrolase n=1 Tax=Microthyrium microscopicum TaxID=703497 RepID=A0A6A6TYT2_9PEZI|nr:alpha/beta-hydrolase [Microthyrium microscopicum]